MDQVEVFRTQEPAKASRAQRLLRNADVQSWTGGEGESTLVLVNSPDVTAAQELLGAYDAVSKLTDRSGPAEADRPFWRQPPAQDRPRPHHRDWRMLKDPPGSSDPRSGR